MKNKKYFGRQGTDMFVFHIGCPEFIYDFDKSHLFPHNAELLRESNHFVPESINGFFPYEIIELNDWTRWYYQVEDVS